MENNQNFTIGLDFGSDSVRAVLTDCSDGRMISSSSCRYPRWQAGKYCDLATSRFRQHPLDYLESMTKVVREVLNGQNPAAVRGIGIDTTGSTPCAVDCNGVPLALNERFTDDPDAMFVLWKDHTALPEAEEILQKAKSSSIDYTRYEGGSYSPEWFWAKYLHILRHNPAVREACAGFVEHCDWIPAELTASPVRTGRCAAGHKAMWHPDWNGYPPESFFTSIDPLFRGRVDSLDKETFTPDNPVGKLSAKWAGIFGLSTDVVVAGGILDCHSGAVGAGIRPGQLVKVVGTSTCEIVVAPEVDRCIPGICGQVDGSVLPGMTGLEAGQSAFGDIYSWFIRFLSYAGEVDFQKLEADAARQSPGCVLALDWHNARRTPFANPFLTGAIGNLTLGTTVPMVYRGLIEATAFGAKRIVEHFIKEGFPVDSILAVGGIPKKSPLVMQICADVLNMNIQIVDTDECCALGGAIFAAVASGVFPDVAKASAVMAAKTGNSYTPDADMSQVYAGLYRKYLACADAVESLISAGK